VNQTTTHISTTNLTQPNPILNSRMFPAVPALLLVALSCCKYVVFYFTNSNLTLSFRFSDTSRRTASAVRRPIANRQHLAHRRHLANRRHPTHRQYIAKRHIDSRGRINEKHHRTSSRLRMCRGWSLFRSRRLHSVLPVLRRDFTAAKLSRRPGVRR
jgi:hypothetical protein